MRFSVSELFIYFHIAIIDCLESDDFIDLLRFSNLFLYQKVPAKISHARLHISPLFFQNIFHFFKTQFFIYFSVPTFSTNSSNKKNYLLYFLSFNKIERVELIGEKRDGKEKYRRTKSWTIVDEIFHWKVRRPVVGKVIKVPSWFLTAPCHSSAKVACWG